MMSSLSEATRLEPRASGLADEKYLQVAFGQWLHQRSPKNHNHRTEPIAIAFGMECSRSMLLTGEFRHHFGTGGDC
jgi:hypothetical protein